MRLADRRPTTGLLAGCLSRRVCLIVVSMFLEFRLYDDLVGYEIGDRGLFLVSIATPDKLTVMDAFLGAEVPVTRTCVALDLE